METSLQIYETMQGLSTQMVEAARTNDWDQLSELEQRIASLRDRLIVQDPVAGVPHQDDSYRARKIALIRQLLADDREIRTHTEPWMDAVKQMLSSTSKQRAVQAAYGGNQGF
jgi:flagellar protein FliT